MDYQEFKKKVFPKVVFSLEDRTDLRVTFQKVYKFFDNNDKKTISWFETKNMNYGGSSPYHLILMGKIRAVRYFVDSRVSDTEPLE